MRYFALNPNEMTLNYIFFVCIALFALLCLFNKNFYKHFYKKYPNDLKELTKVEFENQFMVKGGTPQWKEILDKAWETRNFEIDPLARELAQRSRVNSRETVSDRRTPHLYSAKLQSLNNDRAFFRQAEPQ
jgi:hypothetical protein